MIRNRQAAAMIAGLILALLTGASMILAQGGTNPAKRATAPKKPAGTSRSTTPENNRATSFRPQNPGIKLALIPSGSFMMGSANGYSGDKPVHQVTINYSFYMGKYEVTQAEWQKVMGNNPSQFKNCGRNCPVEQVSWDDAQRFIQTLNQMNDGYTYRLPTEAEWEYACRAGTTEDNSAGLKEMAWCVDNSGERTHPVGQKRLNAWGLADMHGNVWEWCEDWNHINYNGAPTDGSAWLTGRDEELRVVRGQSFNSLAADLRPSFRNAVPPGLRFFTIGFRVVATAQEKG